MQTTKQQVDRARRIRELDPDPCRACIPRTGACDINALNNCVFSVCAAFSGHPNSSVRDKCRKKAEKCVRAAAANWGRRKGWAPNPPPIYLQTPRYVPGLVADGASPSEARAKCIEMCDDSRYPNQCWEACHIDADALEGGSSDEEVPKFYCSHTGICHPRRTDDSEDVEEKTVEPYEHPKWRSPGWWVGIVLALIFGVIILYGLSSIMTMGITQ